MTFSFVALVGAILMATRPRFLLWGVVLTGAAVSANLWLDPNTRAGYGTFIENPNPAAWMVLVAALLLVVQRRPATAIAAGIVLAPLALTGSRLGVVAFFASFGLVILLRRDVRWHAVTALAVAAAFLPLTVDHWTEFARQDAVVTVYAEEYDATFTMEVGSNSVAEIWDRLLLGQVPLPSGIATGSMALTFYHNTPLQIAHDAGWIAGLAWLFIVAAAVWKSRRTDLFFPLVGLIVVSTLDQYTWGYGVAALAAWALLAEATREEAPSA